MRWPWHSAEQGAELGGNWFGAGGGGGHVRVEKTNERGGDPCNLVRQFLKMLRV